MTHKKVFKIIQTLLIAAIAAGAVAITAFAAETIESSGSSGTFTWTIKKDDNGNRMLEIDSSKPASITSLRSLDRKLVHKYTKITLGKNITGLGTEAFNGFESYLAGLKYTKFVLMGDTSFPSGNKFHLGTITNTYGCDVCVKSEPWYETITQETPSPACPNGGCSHEELRGYKCVETEWRDNGCSDDTPLYITISDGQVVRIVFESLTAAYEGQPVTERNYASANDFFFTVKYNSKTVKYPYDASYATLGSLFITNISEGTVVPYTFTDPETATVVKGVITVPCKQKILKSISAQYTGGSVVSGLSYTPDSVKIAMIYDNGDTEYARGSAANVGLYRSNTWTYVDPGDVDQNKALNAADLSMLKLAVKGAITLTNAQKRQADITKDGLVDGKDIEALEAMISRVCGIVGNNTFYASVSALGNSGKTAPVYASFTVPGVKRTPVSLKVYTLPTKTKYVQNENLDPSGMILRVIYDNETEELIPVTGIYSPSSVQVGDSEHPVINLASDQRTMTVYYKEGDKTLKTEFPINVVSHTLTSIKVTKAPSTVEYYEGESFRTAGMEVTAFFDEKISTVPTEEVISASRCVLTGTKKMQDASGYIVIELSNPEDPIEKYVRVLKSKITDGPKEYKTGTIGTWTVSGAGGGTYSGKIVGNYLIKIAYSYLGATKYTYQPITVNPPRLSGLEVLSEPIKKNYISGQNFDPTGLVLRAIYTNGYSKYIYLDDGSGSGYVIHNGQALETGLTEVQARYTEGKFMQYVDISVMVEDANIESVTATYTGKSIFVGSKFKDEDVEIVVTYNDGRTVVTDGKHAVVVPATAGGKILSTTPKDNTIYETGENKFGVIYSGKTAGFSVTGLEAFSSMDFSHSVAKGRSYYSTWEEEFRTTKMRTVADFIRGSLSEGSSEQDTDRIPDTLTENEYHVINTQSPEEDRTELSYEKGTGKKFDISAERSVPLFNFLRQAAEPAPKNSISVIYRGRTEGYLFPDSNHAVFSDNSKYETAKTTPIGYIEAYNQKKAQYSASTEISAGVGWGDWVTNGDSIGTVKTERLYPEYITGSNDTIQTCLHAISIKLAGAPEGASLGITVENTAGTSTTYNEGDVIMNPARIKLTLKGKIGDVPFNSLYKIYYRASNDDATVWSKEGEWAGSYKTPMETLEIKLMLLTDMFDGTSMATRPVITTQTRSTSRIIGESVTFSVIAAGNESGLSYQWYRNGAPISGATENSYTINTVAATDDGSVFFCRVKLNSTGNHSDSTPAVLTVNDQVPAIVTDLEDVAIELDSTANGKATFTIKATSKSLDKLTFAWMTSKDGDEWTNEPADGSPVKDNVGSIEVRKSSFTKSVNGSDSVIYVKCIVSNAIGNVESCRAAIYTSRKPTVDIEFSKGTQSGNQIHIAKGSIPITMTAHVNNARGYVNYDWKVDGVSRSNSTSCSFTPDTVGSHTVSCTASIGSDSITCERTIIVAMVEAPDISGSFVKNAGSYTATLEAQPANSKVTLSWYFDGVWIRNSGGNFTLSVTGSKQTLKITGLADLNHTVTVVAKDQYGSENSTQYNLEDL